MGQRLPDNDMEDDNTRMIMQELIYKFFRNECSEDEKKMVLEYFQTNPAEWDKYLNENEWEYFEVKDKMHPAFSKKIFNKVSGETFRKNNTSKNFAKIAVAASVILLIGLGWLLNNQADTQTNKQSQVTVSDIHSSVAPQLQERINTTAKTISVLLEDGSKIELGPKSNIKYYKPFVMNNKRIVYLTGRALFKVAKDKTKPFTVVSGDISTTALGTSFTVKSFSENNEISVALHEGKVVVKSADSLNRKLQKDIFLLPGDELIYNKNTMLASVNHNTPGDQMVKANPSEKTNTTISKPDWYMFNGLSLSQVFDQLSEYYQVDIYYYPSDVRDKYFAARMEKTDSFDNILNDIALLNHLTINKKNGGYIIKKKIP